MDKKSILIDAAANIGVHLDSIQTNQFLLYYDMLVEKNKVMNLTAITEFDDVLLKHFIDSLSLINAFDLNKKSKIIDVGTGAGFPGIPLKIAFPDLNITLMDSLNKRINFLNEVINALELSGISALHARAEELGKSMEYRESFDLCVSRAVAKLSILSEYCLPFVKPGGKFISYKAGNVSEEIQESVKALSILGGEYNKMEEFVLPQTDIKRTLVIINKVKATPKKYPRASGKPVKEPL